MTQQIKKPKYEFNGQGFSNKRDYMNAQVIYHLSDEGKEKLVTLSEKAFNKVRKRYPDFEDKKISRMLHYGFDNSQNKKLSQNLQEVADSLTTKGRVDLVIFSYIAGGGVIELAREILFRKDFSETGLSIVGNKIGNDEQTSLTEPQNNLPVEKEQNDYQIRTIISEEINVSDRLD